MIRVLGVEAEMETYGWGPSRSIRLVCLRLTLGFAILAPNPPYLVETEMNLHMDVLG